MGPLAVFVAQMYRRNGVMGAGPSRPGPRLGPARAPTPGKSASYLPLCLRWAARAEMVWNCRSEIRAGQIHDRTKPLIKLPKHQKPSSTSSCSFLGVAAPEIHHEILAAMGGHSYGLYARCGIGCSLVGSAGRRGPGPSRRWQAGVASGRALPGQLIITRRARAWGSGRVTCPYKIGAGILYESPSAPAMRAGRPPMFPRVFWPRTGIGRKPRPRGRGVFCPRSPPASPCRPSWSGWSRRWSTPRGNSCRRQAFVPSRSRFPPQARSLPPA